MVYEWDPSGLVGFAGAELDECDSVVVIKMVLVLITGGRGFCVIIEFISYYIAKELRD